MKDEAYGVRAVARAVGVLAALAAADTPRTLTEIAAGAGLSVPTTFRLLRTLQSEGLVSLGREGGRYTLGSRILEFGHAYLRQFDIVSVARPFLVAARNRVHETVGLAVRSGDSWVPILSVEASQPVRRVMHPGEPTPLYASGTGKLLLAGEPDDEIEAYLARTRLEPFSATTVNDPETLRAQIREIRERGYSCSVNERGAGGVGISAPVYAHDGGTVAAVIIAAPASRFTPEMREACVEVVLDASRGISTSLGFRGAVNGYSSATPAGATPAGATPAGAPAGGAPGHEARIAPTGPHR